jgi:hypothetical protein
MPPRRADKSSTDGDLGRFVKREVPMGKRLPKPQLLEEIGVEHKALDALLHPLQPRQMTQRNVTASGWSVKDILGHLVSW